MHPVRSSKLGAAVNRSFFGHAGRGRRFRLQAGTLRGSPPQACRRHACAPGPRIRRCSRIPAPVPRLSEGPVFRTHARPISPAALYNKEQRRIPRHRLTSCLDVHRRANPVQAKSVRGLFILYGSSCSLETGELRYTWPWRFGSWRRQKRRSAPGDISHIPSGSPAAAHWPDR